MPANVITEQPSRSTSPIPSNPSQVTPQVVLDTDTLKKKRTSARRKITLTCNDIERTILARGSRRGVQNLLAAANLLLEEAGQANDQLLEDDNIVDFDQQHQMHNRYVVQVGKMTEEVERYILDRADDPASIAPPPVDPEAVRRDEERRQAMLAAQRRADAARVEIEEAEQALRQFQLPDQRLPEPEPDLDPDTDEIARWCEEQRRQAAAHRHQDEATSYRKRDELAPDNWIDLYRDGHLPPSRWTDTGPRSSIKADLEVFSGRTLDWFSWIYLFRALVHDSSKAPGEKLAILKRSLRGDCLDVVYGLGGGEMAYIEALTRLKATYGRRDVMRAAHIQAIDKLDFNKSDPTSFKRFAEKIRTHLFDLSRVGESTVVDIIERVCLKLQLADRIAWNTDRGNGLETRSLNQFGSWLCSRASAYQNAYSIASEQHFSATSRQRERQQARAHQTSSNTNTTNKGKKTKKTPFCFKCEGDHRLEDCQGFKECSVGERVTFCVRHRLCFCCFGTRHSSRDCQFRRECQIDNCKRNHHILLHDPPATPTNGRTCTASTGSSCVTFGVIRLNVIGEDGAAVEANIMYDEGSDTTLIREGLARQLRMPSQGLVSLSLEGAAAIKSQHTSHRVCFKLRSESGEILQLQGTTLETVTRPVPITRWEQLKNQWPHLRDLPLGTSGGRIDILLGLDQAHLMGVIEARNGKEYEPIASRTRLGWIVRGVVDNRVLAARVNHVYSTPAENENLLAQQVRRFCDTENFGTEFRVDGLSLEDQQAIAALESGTRKLEVGYEVPIIWKTGEPDLLSNRALAERRFNGLLNRFDRDPDYEKDYRAAMDKYFEKGYAVYVEDADLGMPEYFLAHHGVYKGIKLRVVYDAAAPYRGKCLNDAILSGPALQTPLPSVITKFREGAIAWAADVEAMFSRIRLRPADARYFRFLWKRKGEEKVAICEMRSLPFGATCSPFIAISTTRRAAKDSGADPVVTNAILSKMYVDDYLSSAKDLNLAIKEATDVNRVLAEGDFHLQGWVSNSADFLKAVAPTKTAVSREIVLDGGENEKVLGVYWNPAADTFNFNLTSLEDVSFTRVGLVSKVASIFDPIGMASTLTVKAKIKIRELGIKGLGWNEEVIDEDFTWWKRWFQTLYQLNNINVPRCLFPDEDDIVTSELHTFGDASEEAYAAVVFVRHVYKNGLTLVRQIRSATKLAPKKTISVPKLELNAALLAARLTRSVEEALTCKNLKRVFWTDSSTVRNWIRATAAFYQTFVSNRIGEIQTITQPEEWRFVPGKFNPADHATRSSLEEEAIPAVWWTGPEFLSQPEESWPKDLPWMAVKEEIRSSRVHHNAVRVPDFNWEEIEIKSSDITALSRLQEPFLEMVRRCQEESYEEDIDRLRKGKTLRSTSSLLALHPIIDQDGIIRLGGRAGKAKLPYDQLHPPLLPGSHKLARKIITAFHLHLNHVGTDYLLSYLRQHFWITNGREAIKKVRRDCLACRKERAQPGEQLMGELPKSRLEYGSPPFSNTACDLFGPMEIGLSRNRTAKRWGVLFTCLVTRAVFLDLATSLSSDDFLLVFRRFIGLYGKPHRMHSDNGTNFVGAERELREAAEELYQNGEVEDYMKRKGILWIFQPARTPHFGGAHESLVRSTKKALYRALDQEKGGLRHPSEETLRTLLYEVAGILNSRPLTYASSDPNDYRPLTPNDFLNKPVTADPPTGNFDDALPREHYRYVQKMANLFWDLWKTVYLQSLASRHKWKKIQPNFAVGDAVLEIDKTLRRGQWKLGRVTKVFPGSDGLVRAVDVQLSTGIFRRGINQLCLLESSSSSSTDQAEPDSGEDVPAK